MSRVVDTNVVSFLFKKDTRGELYRPYLDGHVLTVSFMTVAELDRWALEKNWGKAKVARMDRFLRRCVVYPFSRELGRRWAAINVAADCIGRPIGEADAWIAATALVLGHPLVTHNPTDFETVDGLKIETEAGR